MECNPQFCPAVLGGPQPGDCQLKFLGQNETHKKAEDVPLRERINNQCVLKSEFTSHNSKILVLQFFFFFACQSGFGKEGTKGNFTFLYGPGAIDRDRRASFGKNSYPLSALASFSGIPRADSGGSAMPQRSGLGHQILDEEK